MPSVIKIENLSKVYQLGEIGTGTISRDLERWYAKVRGKDDPFLKIDDGSSVTGRSDVVWSLRDVSLEIEQGDAVGIIGRNGAGKSTLLKLLSRVTAPTSGSIKLKGRIASLLEVGTGFHPELTGRENIFLNGAILGMRKKEIQRKLDEIIDFSGIERFIDTPVKRYSSGMYVRLAFAVAAHLESEIMIVDEVLAVGDAEFQRKCLDKMNSVSDKEGRTIIFVSHNMAAIKALCNKAIVLEKGMVMANTDAATGMKLYLQSNIVKDKMAFDTIAHTDMDEFISWKKIGISQNGNELPDIQNNKPFTVSIEYELKKDITGFRMFADIADDNLVSVCKSFFDEQNDTGTDVTAGSYKTTLTFPSDLFIEGDYIITVFAGIHGVKILQPENGIPLAVHVLEMGDIRRRRFDESFKGLITLPLSWATTPAD